MLMKFDIRKKEKLILTEIKRGEKEREREQKALTITISSKTTILYQVLLVIILWNLKVNCRIFKTHHFTGLDIKKIFQMLIQIKPVVVL